jgi:hypothetical protein
MLSWWGVPATEHWLKPYMVCLSAEAYADAPVLCVLLSPLLHPQGYIRNESGGFFTS